MSREQAHEMLMLLRRLGQEELDEELDEQVQAELHSGLVPLVGADRAERLEYASYEVDWGGLQPKLVQGLGVESSGLLLTEIVDQMAALDDEHLAELGAPLGLGPEQLRAAFYAIYWILNALEWESRDRSVEAEYSPEQRERMLASRLRSLISFRTTGEP